MSADEKIVDSADARRATRKSIRTLGEIVHQGAPHGQECTILDMSATGARLQLSAANRKAFSPVVEIPETFRLVIPRDNISVECRRAWRDRDIIGVSFTSTLRPLKTPVKRA